MHTAAPPTVFGLPSKVSLVVGKGKNVNDEKLKSKGETLLLSKSYQKGPFLSKNCAF